jgi:hypothetical protein
MIMKTNETWPSFMYCVADNAHADASFLAKNSSCFLHFHPAYARFLVLYNHCHNIHFK